MNILGFNYSLIAEKDHDDALGRSHIRELKIRIDPNIPQQHKEATMLHEIVEVLAYELHLEFPQDQHKVIMPLCASLYQVLVNAGVDLSPLTNELERKTK